MTLFNGEHVVGLAEKLALNRPLTIKLGFDPTAPDLHLGHFIVLRTARKFQDAGHHVHIIVGDFTASIGDPSGRNQLRPPLGAQAIADNAKTYMDQAFLVLDPRNTHISMNKSWFDALSMSELLKLLASTTVQQIMERDDFKNRFAEHTPIYMHEMLYPLMQAYDSVQIKADVELGGTDQLFNLMMGRVLQKASGQPEQAILTSKILPGTNGVDKMSKSKNNYIGLTDSPEDMFGKTMSISDTIMWTWYELLVEATDAQMASLKAQHPRAAKVQLAYWIVSKFHGEEAAQLAMDAFEARFAQKDFSAVDSVSIPASAPMHIIDLLTKLGVVSSKSDARRKIEQAGVRVNHDTVVSYEHQLPYNTPFLLEVGKKFAKRITLC